MYIAGTIRNWPHFKTHDYIENIGTVDMATGF